MFYRFFALSLSFAFSSNILLVAQSAGAGADRQNAGAVQGRVLSAKSQPLAAIHIELDDAATAVPVSSTYSGPDGTFEMYNIPAGQYEVVAETPDSEVSNVVSVNQGGASIQLKFPRTSHVHVEQSGVVPVAQLQVSFRAQELYGGARGAFRRNDYDRASKLLAQALQIEPDYSDALTLRGLIELPNPDPHVPQQTLEHAVRLNPADSSARIALAAVYNRESRFDDAMQNAQRAAALTPHVWQAYLEMAKAAVAKALYPKGIMLIREAERRGGTGCAEVHLVKAYALQQLKLYKHSKYEAETAIAHDRSGQFAARARQLLAMMNAEETAIAEER